MAQASIMDKGGKTSKEYILHIKVIANESENIVSQQFKFNIVIAYTEYPWYQ